MHSNCEKRPIKITIIIIYNNHINYILYNLHVSNNNIIINQTAIIIIM